jgi:outer membrane protein W
MKKVYSLFISLNFLLFFSNHSIGQIAEEGRVFIDAYYGAPNFGKTFSKSISLKNLTIANNIESLGPLGIRMEYMLADQIGLGLDVIYNSFGFDFKYDSLSLDGNLYKTYEGSAAVERLRIQARFNYHFKVSNPQLDTYFGIGAGSNTRFWSFEVPANSFNVDRISGSGALIPVSFRMSTGFRYYFNNNIGLNMEIGLGGPLISGGLSFAFSTSVRTEFTD